MANTLKLESALSEFLGTFVLVHTIGCVSAMGGASGPFAIAASLMVMIYALRDLGAHFNPAVSIAIWLSGHPRWPGEGWQAIAKVGMFITAQCVGGFLGALTSMHVMQRSWPALPAPGLESMAAELIYTTMLCFVVLRAACAPSPWSNYEDNEYFGLAIGLVIVAGGYAVGPLSGAVLNPAAAASLDLLAGGAGWPAYVLVQLIGSACAAGLNRLLESKPVETLALKGRQFLAEVVGTFFLVVTVGFNVTGGSAAPAFSIGASLLSMVYSLGFVSGAHLNPAVTFAAACAGLFSWADVPHYCIGQVLGGLLGSLTVLAVTGHAFPLQPPQAYLWGHCAVVEVVYTALLCLVVLLLAMAPADKPLSKGGKGRQVSGLAVGFTVVGGAMAAGPVSGGVLNPAVAIAVDTAFAVGHGGMWLNWVAYTLMHITGALLAVGCFKVVRPTPRAERAKNLQQ